MFYTCYVTELRGYINHRIKLRLDGCIMYTLMESMQASSILLKGKDLPHIIVRVMGWVPLLDMDGFWSKSTQTVEGIQ